MNFQMYGNQPNQMDPFNGPDNDDNNQFDDYNTPNGDDGLDLENGQMNGNMNGQMNGQMNGHMDNMMDSNEFSPEKKLQLAERANEIYRQQLRYMQDHLASLRSLIQDKEYVIENLMLRFDLGILQEDPNKANNPNLNNDEINQGELVRKAEALAQRTILENFELREMVNELRDENFHLRNEIYELQDRINRQVLQINKLEKNNNEDDLSDDVDDLGDDDLTDDVDDLQDDQQEDPANTQEARAIREQRAQKREHRKNQSSVAAPKGMWDDSQNPESSDSGDENDPANTEEARAIRAQREQKRAHRKQQSSVAAPQGMWKDGDAPDEEDSDADLDDIINDYANTDEAQAIRDQREQKRTHRKQQSSVAAPKEIFQTQDEINNDNNSDSDQSYDNNDETRENKRRGSQVVDTPDDPRFTDAAIAKREARKQKHHRRESSAANPNIMSDNYDPVKGARDADNRMKKYSNEAKSKRAEREAQRKAENAMAKKNIQNIAEKKKHHKRESSAHFRQLFEENTNKNKLAPKDEKEKEAARRKSVMNHLENIGKGHLSDEDIVPTKTSREKKKPQRADRYDYSNPTGKQRKKSIVGGSGPAGAVGTGATTENIDPTVIANVEAIANNLPPTTAPAAGTHHRRDSSNPVPDLHLEDTEVLLHWEKLRVKDLQEQLLKVEQEAQEQKKNIGKLQQLQTDVTKKEKLLKDAYVAKGELITQTSNEITRLTLIINSLLSIPKIRDIVELVIQDSITQAKKHNLI